MHSPFYILYFFFFSEQANESGYIEGPELPVNIFTSIIFYFDEVKKNMVGWQNFFSSILIEWPITLCFFSTYSNHFLVMVHSAVHFPWDFHCRLAS